MLRRSLILVLALALLGLAYTASYALLPVRKPQDLLRDANAMIARGECLAAVQLLDRSEASPAFAQSTDLHAELRRIRLQAHRVLDVPARALLDIEALLGEGDRSPGLQMDRVYYLARLGQGEEARKAGLELVKEQPKSARAMELAGEACKVAYTPNLRAMAARIRSDMGFDREKQAVASLLEFLYRPEGDASVAAAAKKLRDLYYSESRLMQSWPAMQESLANLRSNIQEATGFFLRALETAGQDQAQHNLFYAAAFQGVSYSLEQAGREDDLDAQSEIYFSSFTHRYRTEAANTAAQVRYRSGLYESAIDIAENCAPIATFSEDVTANRFTPGIRQLLITRSMAHYQLGQKEALAKLASAIQKPAEKIPFLQGLQGLAWGLHHSLSGQKENRTSSLKWIVDMMLREPSPQDGADPLDLLVPLLLDSAAADGKAASDLLSTIDGWVDSRPGNPLPMQNRARWQIRFSQDAAAMATAAAILQERPTDEAALRLLAEASDNAYKASHQDGASLLMHCLQSNLDRPDSPPNPVCYLLCAEAALKQQQPWIARTCARLAADRFPWSEWPVLTQARAEAMMGNIEAAIETLDRLLERKPDSKEAIKQCFQIRIQNGMPVRALLARAVAAMPGSPMVLAELLRAALEEKNPSALALARRAAAQTGAGSELLGLAATALARHANAEAGRAMLARARAAADASAPGSAAELMEAELACLVVESATRTDAEAAAAAERFVTASTFRGPESGRGLIAAARELTGLRRPLAASTLLSAALAAGDAIEIRDGATHAFAGDLSLALSRIAAARESYTAAISFEDGHMVAERLARLELLADSPARAVAAFAATASPKDAALALLTASNEALQIARAQLAKDPGDLLATLAFAALSDPKKDPLAEELRSAGPEAVRKGLLACTLLADPLLAKPALDAATVASRLAPRSLLVSLLHARAMQSNDDSAGAAAMHARLYDEGRRSPLLWREVARCASQSGYQPPTSILVELREVAQRQPTSLHPDTLAMLALRSAADAERLGQPDIAVGIRADVWRHYPAASGARLQDAETLRAADRTAAAVELLHSLRALAEPAQRAEISSSLYQLAAPSLGELPAASRSALREEAIADLTAGIAPGEAFLLLIADAGAMAATKPEAALGLAKAALASAACGAATWAVGSAALQEVKSRTGSGGALRLVEDTLAAHPASARLWVARAALCLELSDGGQGLEDARAMLTFFDEPEVAIELLTLAAERRKITRTDVALLAGLTQANLDPAAAKLAAGWFALRAGKAAEAEAAFAASGVDTAQVLYARAMANLMRRDATGRKSAKAMFAKLRATQPSSSFARNVGSFELQLGPN